MSTNPHPPPNTVTMCSIFHTAILLVATVSVVCNTSTVNLTLDTPTSPFNLTLDTPTLIANRTEMDHVTSMKAALLRVRKLENVIVELERSAFRLAEKFQRFKVKFKYIIYFHY